MDSIKQQQGGMQAKPATGDERVASEVSRRPDYDNALETLRRVRELTGDPTPTRILRENTRGSWTRSAHADTRELA